MKSSATRLLVFFGVHAAQFEPWSRQTAERRKDADAGRLPSAEYERVVKV
jgi:hypothetical protein